MDDLETIRGKLGEILAILGEREKLYNERFLQNEKQTALAMTELQRRLDVLNHAHQVAREKEITFLSKEAYQIAHDQLVDDVKRFAGELQYFVRGDKYEDKLKADGEKFEREAEARATALQRVDEKFEEYVKRYEQRQREVDLLLTAQKAAAEAAKQAAEDEGRRSRQAVQEQSRKTNRNLAVVSLILGGIVIVVNVLLTLLK